MHSFLFSRSDVKISAVHVAAESEVCLVQFFFGVQFFKTKLLPFTEIMKIEATTQGRMREDLVSRGIASGRENRFYGSAHFHTPAHTLGHFRLLRARLACAVYITCSN